MSQGLVGDALFTARPIMADPTTVVALFMITFTPDVYYLFALECVHATAYFIRAYVEAEPCERENSQVYPQP